MHRLLIPQINGAENGDDEIVDDIALIPNRQNNIESEKPIDVIVDCCAGDVEKPIDDKPQLRNVVDDTFSNNDGC